MPGHLKRERLVHDLEEAEKHCALCAQELREFGEETSERYEYIPAQLIVIEDVYKKYSGACTVKTAGKPSWHCLPVRGGEMRQSYGKVLIVDDESSIRRALRNTLQTMGFNVDDASNGEAALQLVHNTPYDVVLLDINMPGIGGIKACREILRSLPRLGILMLTVRDSEDDQVGALDAGAEDFIKKPFSIRELAARIRAAVRRSAAPSADPNAVIRLEP